MYIETSCNFHKIPYSQSRVIKKFYDLLGRPSYMNYHSDKNIKGEEDTVCSKTYTDQY